MKTRFSELDLIYPDFQSLSPGQQQILDSAMNIFAEKGFASASTGAIAKQAGVAEGLIFKHFRTKKNLFLSLIRPLAFKVFFPLSIQRIQAILNQDMNLADLLEAILRERLSFALQHRPVIKILLQEIWLHPELLDGLMQQFNQVLRTPLQQKFEAFQATGAVRPMAFETFLRLMVSQFIGFILPRVILFPDKNWDDEREIQETLQTLLQGLACASEMAS